MSNTVWKKLVKEGFKEGIINNEHCIMELGKNCKDNTDPSQNQVPPKNTFFERLSSLFNNFNPTDAKNLYTDFITTAKTGADGIKDVIAGIISGISPNPTEGDKGEIAKQVAMWIAVVPASYWLIINWWYVMCYTNYTIDFRKFIWTPIHWVMAPALHALELFSYYTLTFRMDVDSKIPADFSRRLWNWRPVVFSVIHGIIVSFMMAFSTTDALMNSMLNTGIVFIIASVLSVYYYVSLFIQEKWYEKFINNGVWGYFGLFGLTVLSFIGMFVFIGMICPIFTLYFSFLSYFVLFAFNKFWPPSVISICEQIFQELKEAPVDETSDKWGKLKNVAFQNFHSIYLLIIMLGFFSAHVHQAMSFSSESLIFVAILANLIICILFAPSAFSVPFELLKVFLDDSETTERTHTPPEADISNNHT